MNVADYELHIRYPLEYLIPFHAGYYKEGDILTISVGERVIKKARVVFISGDMIELKNIKVDEQGDDDH